MPCYHPLNAWRSAIGVTFHCIIDSTPLKLPCGRCIGCRLDRSRQWAVRLMHELRFHEESSFITLTYAPEHLPYHGGLELKHFQDFMKRLRKSSDPKRIRFFHAGEYGEEFGRPHYHAIIFGESFCKLGDVYDAQETDLGDTTWSSRRLDRLWGHGMARIGAVTFESCAYVARYVTKKVTGDAAAWHYERISEVSGEVFNFKPEYATMSRRPGIGFGHFQQYRVDIYPSDEVVSRGHPSKPPKFYDRLLEKADPEMYAFIKEQREFALMLSPSEDRSPERLAVRETVKLAQVGHLTRRYELG